MYRIKIYNLFGNETLKTRTPVLKSFLLRLHTISNINGGLLIKKNRVASNFKKLEEREKSIGPSIRCTCIRYIRAYKRIYK